MTDSPVTLVSLEFSVPEPFETMYHREYAGLVRLAMVLVDNQEQAEEVVQDAFAALYVRYQSVATPLAYVRASVLNGSTSARDSVRPIGWSASHVNPPMRRPRHPAHTCPGRADT